ncbi:DUF4142 domain-containing protein [Hyalangium minutum]|uniref:DUF4142 domain-containing protein n=1 Tax=Hyalangium minutum TaxID=394096 RepID=A0A085WK71_9BACT|nr:DUF4142 domain-containing protein [Hyalangium minutum]KFE68084.1 hypothetical protein DB31_7321 [Hyalangium minutum]
MKRTIQGLLLAGSLVLGGTALAQSTTQATPGVNPGSQGVNRGSQGIPQGQAMKGKSMAKDGMLEHTGFMIPADEKAMLERLHHVNQAEIKLGQLAQQNAQSPDVKSYGETLVKDHTAADQKVMSYAQQKGLKLAEPQPMNDVERKSMAAHKANMEKLQALKGTPFDSCFLAIMVGGHDEALGQLMAAKQGTTDASLTPLLQDLITPVTQHRQQAYTLLGRIGPGAGTGVGGSGSMKPMDSGTGGAGDTHKGSQDIGTQNKMDPGNTKKY